MRKYIILTPEGQTIAPNINCQVENFQVLGIVENVKDENEAIINLLKENPWIIDAEYNVSEFILHELL
jgi:DNA-binding MarR family transcriptional regulator